MRPVLIRLCLVALYVLVLLEAGMVLGAVTFHPETATSGDHLAWFVVEAKTYTLTAHLSGWSRSIAAVRPC